jgi:hypothetical protein
MKTGKFSTARPKTAVEIIENRARQVPAPDYYQTPKTVDPEKLKGVKFSDAFPKNYIEWTEYYAKQLPGPSDYRIPTPRMSGGRFSEARPKSSVDWVVYFAKQTPGPNRYKVTGQTRYGSTIPGGGRIGSGNPLGYIELEINRTRDNPGPGQYNLVKLPPSGRKPRFKKKKNYTYSAQSKWFDQVSSLEAMALAPRQPILPKKSYKINPGTTSNRMMY